VICALLFGRQLQCYLLHHSDHLFFIERIVEDVSFDAPDKEGETIEIDDAYVRTKVTEMLLSTDLKKYIL
jgi:ATP-dependent protease HslVU (ClpYQ) ATPase subunit